MDHKTKNFEETIKTLLERIENLEQKLKKNENLIGNILENQRMMEITIVSSKVDKSITYNNSMKKLVDNF